MTEATPLASEQITQEDREAAADLLFARGMGRIDVKRIQTGANDQHHVVQAFARHRIAALSASPAPSGQGVSGEVWQHVKRGTRYAVIGTATLQATGPLHDYAQVVVYRGDDGALWAREESEFRDGRFVRLAAPAPSCAPGEVEREWLETAHQARVETFKQQRQTGVVDAVDWLVRYAEQWPTPAMAYEAGKIARIMRDAIAPEGTTLLPAALSPQGLDAKEGECPSSPDGKHQVDTSMESGPNNCFHCEAPMGGN